MMDVKNEDECRIHWLDGLKESSSDGSVAVQFVTMFDGKIFGIDVVFGAEVFELEPGAICDECKEEAVLTKFRFLGETFIDKVRCERDIYGYAHRKFQSERPTVKAP